MDASTELGVSSADASAGTFAAGVTRFEPGEGATFGHQRMPGIVLGPPVGAGDMLGGTDVVSLGAGGVLCLRFDGFVRDGPGADFIVFENAFTLAGTSRSYVELGEVSVSEDGNRWERFPCQTTEPYTNCAGKSPVYSNPTNSIPPTDWRHSGGDAFDLSQVGLSRIRYVCIRDLRTEPPVPPAAGFDLDAISAVHYDPNP